MIKSLHPLLAVTTAAALLLVACGSADDSSEPADSAATTGDEAEPGDAGEMTDVKVGSIPIFNNALLFVAIEKGYFADEGLNVELVPSTNFGAGLSAVLNGENQFAFGSSVPVIAAASQDAPIRLVSGSEIITSGTTVEGSPDLVVTDDPATASAADLAGKTVAINANVSIGALAVREAVRRAGGDADSITFVEIPYPDNIPTLQAGRVDSSALLEPFTTQGRSAGLQIVDGALWSDGLPDQTLIDVYFTSQSMVDENPETVEAFARAIDSAADFATNNLDEVRAFLPDYVPVDASVAEAANFYAYDSTIDEDQITSLSELMLTNGFIDEAVDPSAVLVER